MTFRTFTTADTLFDMLVQKYCEDSHENLTVAEFQERGHHIGIQRNVLTIFTMWLEDHQLLEEEPHIAQRMTEFLRLIISPPLSTMATHLIQTIERLVRWLPSSICLFLMYNIQTFATPANPSPRNPPRRRRKSYPHKNDLLKLYTADVAEQLSLLEFKLYAKVTSQECIRHATSSRRSESNLVLFCRTHDKLAAWVKTSILSNSVLGKRADTIDFWIKVAEVSVMCCVVKKPISYIAEMQTVEQLLVHECSD
jgi:son of sevenless